MQHFDQKNILLTILHCFAAYKKCVTDTFCASQTVRVYMEKYAKVMNSILVLLQLIINLFAPALTKNFACA